MKQVFSGAGHIVLAIFTVAIIVFMAIMNYQTLGRVFPDDPSQQLWGMVLFTGGTLCWFTIFLLASRGFQRPIALVMFFLSLGGEVLYSAADVIMGGQKWIEQTPALGTYVIYSFIFLTFAHGLALYIHFFVKPEVWASVDLEAIEDSVKKMAQERAAELINLRIEPMADQLAARVTNSVYANLRLPVPDVIDGVVLQDDTNDLRQAQAATDDAKKAGWFDWLFAWKTKQSQQDPAATPTPAKTTRPTRSRRESCPARRCAHNAHNTARARRDRPRRTAESAASKPRRPHRNWHSDWAAATRRQRAARSARRPRQRQATPAGAARTNLTGRTRRPDHEPPA